MDRSASLGTGRAQVPGVDPARRGDAPEPSPDQAHRGSRPGDPPRPAGARAALVTAAAAGGIALLLVVERRLPIGVTFAALALPPLAWFTFARAERGGIRCDPRVLVAAIGGLLLLAVALPPRGSLDLWSYVMYGRMVSHHASSPYLHVPNDFRTDPFFHRVATGWRNTPSVYGPVFTAVAALGSFLAGGSALAARLFHQGLAAIAVVVALRLIWTRTRSTAALALLGLNPLVIVSVVNGGHNDALVGLALLGATLLATTDRPGSAGVCVALGALVKVTALLAAPVLLVWIAYRVGRRAAANFAVATAVTVALGYAIAGWAAVTTIGTNGGMVSRASLWDLPLTWAGARNRLVPGGWNPHWTDAAAAVSVLLVGAIVLVVAWRRRRDAEPAEAVALALCAYLVFGMYVLPWYVIWMIPVAAVSTGRLPHRLVLLFSALLPAVYAVKARALPHAVAPVWQWVGSGLVPVALLAVFAVAVLARPAAPDAAPPVTAAT